MKKNLISIIVLGMVVANLVVSVMTLMTISSASTKVTTLITDISSVLALELTDSSVTLQPAGLSQDDIDVYSISKSMNIQLKASPEDTKTYVAVVEVSVLMDKTNPDYSKYGKTLGDAEGGKEVIIQSAVQSVISSHTKSEVEVDQDSLRNEILEQIQQEFGSTFIYEVKFKSFMISTM